MVAQAPWFERKFHFDTPVGVYPDILERLRGTPARVEEAVRSFPADILTRRDGETWSIQENVGHLIDLEPIWIGRVEDIKAGEEMMRPADLTNRKTHEANHNARPVDELLTAFREIRKQFITQLDACDASTFAATALHPRLKQPMGLIDLCSFVADHDDYHLARMRELSRLFAA